MAANIVSQTTDDLRRGLAHKLLASVFAIGISAIFATDAAAGSAAGDVIAAATAKKAKIDTGNDAGTRMPMPYMAPDAQWTVWLTEGQIRLSDLIYQGAYATNARWSENGAIVATPRMGFAAGEERALQAIEAALDIRRNHALRDVAKGSRDRLAAIAKSGGTQADRAARELKRVDGQIARLTAAIGEAEGRYRSLTGQATAPIAGIFDTAAIPADRTTAARDTVALFRTLMGDDHAGFQSTAYGVQSGSTGLSFDMLDGQESIAGNVSGNSAMGGMVRLGVPLGNIAQVDTAVRGGGGGEAEISVGDVIAKREETARHERCAVRRIIAAYDAIEAAEAGKRSLASAKAVDETTVAGIADAAERRAAAVNLDHTAVFAHYNVLAGLGTLAGTARTVTVKPLQVQTAEVFQ